MEELAAILQQNNVDTTTLNLLSNFNGETIYYLTTPGGQVAVDLWHKLRGLVEQTGYWPVILGKEENLRRVIGDLKNTSETASQIIEKAVELDALGWLQKRKKDVIVESEDFDEFRGEWPDLVLSEEPDEFSLPFHRLSSKPLEKAFLALVPTKISWQTPAFLKTGNWNYCPIPAEHCAMLKHWQEIYGSEIVCICSDTIEMLVTRPPTTKEKALKLAEEQFIYAADIVEQGTTTIENLASILLNGTTWYFWWD